MFFGCHLLDKINPLFNQYIPLLRGFLYLSKKNDGLSAKAADFLTKASCIALWLVNTT